MFISNANAQTTADSLGLSGNMMANISSFLPFILMFVVLYFLMIRPQQKRAKEHKALMAALTKGDEVVTAGGMLAKVNKLGETFLTVEVANGVEIQIQRTAVIQVLPKGTIK